MSGKIVTAPNWFNEERSFKCGLNRSILEDLMKHFGVKNTNMEIMENTCFERMGNNVLEWANYIATQLKDESLSIRVANSFAPKLTSDRDGPLQQESLQYAIRMYQSNPDYKFVIFPPIEYGNNLSEKVFEKTLENRRVENPNVGEPVRFGWLINKPFHWVALYLDLNEHECTFEYFDSLGNKADKITLVTIKSIISFIKAKYPDKNYYKALKFTDHKLQFGATECGVFCLWFFFMRLSGENYSSFFNQKIGDKDMKTLRTQFWN